MQPTRLRGETPVRPATARRVREVETTADTSAISRPRPRLPVPVLLPTLGGSTMACRPATGRSLPEAMLRFVDFDA